MSGHPWSARGAHPWTERDSDSEDDYTEPTPQERAVENFLEVLLELYFISQISAEHVTTLVYWAQLGGLLMTPMVAGIKKKPGSGHYSRHINNALGLTCNHATMYRFNTYGHATRAASRDSISVTVHNPHEVIGELFQSNGTYSNLQI